MLVAYNIKAFMRTFLLTVADASKAWRVTVRTVFLWRRNGRICAALARLITRLCTPHAPGQPLGWHAGQRIERDPPAGDVARWVLGERWAEKLARRYLVRRSRPYGRADLDDVHARLCAPTAEAAALVMRAADWVAPLLNPRL